MNRHHIDKIIIYALSLSVALPPACMAASPVPNKRDQAIKLYGAKNYRAAVELSINVNRCRPSASATS